MVRPEVEQEPGSGPSQECARSQGVRDLFMLYLCGFHSHRGEWEEPEHLGLSETRPNGDLEKKRSFEKKEG